MVSMGHLWPVIHLWLGKALGCSILGPQRISAIMYYKSYVERFSLNGFHCVD